MNTHFYAGHLDTSDALKVRDNRQDDAVDLLAQALTIRERVYGKSHPQVASTLNELGRRTAVA